MSEPAPNPPKSRKRKAGKKRGRKAGLTIKSRRFAKELTTPGGEGFGNATKAAKLAGYNQKAAGQIGHKLIKKDEIAGEISRLLDSAGVTDEKWAKRLDECLDAKEVKVFLPKGSRSPVYSKPLIAHDVRMRTVEMIGKLRGRFPTQRTIERLELLQIQQNILIVPLGQAQLEPAAVEAEAVRVVADE